MVKHFIKGLALMVAMLSSICLAEEMRYFEGKIDYWNGTSKPQDDNAQQQKAKKSPLGPAKKEDAANKSNEEEKFQWNKYLDPKNREFFREGDYTPPEPFMELVRNPTDQNIRMWFAYMERKNSLAGRLAKRMEEYAQANAPSIPRESKAKIVQAARQIPTPADDFERFRFRMYFDSECPHCKRMFETLDDLQDRGYFVEARQIDRGRIDHIKSQVSIVSASEYEVKKYKVTAVPLLLIGDLRDKKVYRQSGFMTPEEILVEVRRR